MPDGAQDGNLCAGEDLSVGLLLALGTAGGAVGVLDGGGEGVDGAHAVVAEEDADRVAEAVEGVAVEGCQCC